MGIHALRYKEARDLLFTFPMSSREAKLLDQLMVQTREAKALNDAAAQNMLSDLPIEEIQARRDCFVPRNDVINTTRDRP